ncbi:unnamed protein product [Parascedosporium putredinis]|uniref:Alpha/beta hydrolase fold-3 domain-containing protein n=1 Tax=Parascedosporium putredinis TaxID=1442378 RepID=A0A9P1H1K1_9PEZI|nr:unnamed protein product [Parascedosporium putredinis]CAI7992840.1 unnamed protein product [Parascedosporium putredinis]
MPGQHAPLRYIRLKLAMTTLRAIRRKIRIPSRDGGRTITAFLYTRRDAPSGEGALSPVLLNWHGSGFVINAFGTDADFCARVARDARIAVLDLDYRKSPETVFPGAVNDVADVLDWVAADSDAGARQMYGLDPSRVAVSGFSAGGNLALVAASSLHGQVPGLDLRAAVAFYPVTDISIGPAAKVAPKPKRVLPVPLQRYFNECYTPDPADRLDPRVSPSLADLASYPPTVAIFTCDGDGLAPEANALADRLNVGDAAWCIACWRMSRTPLTRGARKGRWSGGSAR